MTEITQRQAFDQAERTAESAERAAHVQQEIGKHHHDPLIRIELTGCPNLVPRMMIPRSRLSEEKLKIPFGNGYDHFVLDSHISRNGHLVPVFAWVDRTKIAE